jgi:hypothetical protein
MQTACLSMAHLQLTMDIIERQVSLLTPCLQPYLPILKKMLLF